MRLRDNTIIKLKRRYSYVSKIIERMSDVTLSYHCHEWWQYIKLGHTIIHGVQEMNLQSLLLTWDYDNHVTLN